MRTIPATLDLPPGLHASALSLIILASPLTHAAEWSGNVSTELRVFTQDALYADQRNASLSVAVQPEFHHHWDGDQQSFSFAPFLRVDQYDAERSHADIRELTWLSASPTYEWRVGIRKVFWGVTESQHLVDIINQTDGMENPDGEDKLGQPMVNLALIRGWGTVDLFVLPGFRERTFPAAEGRPRLALPVDTEHAEYQSSRAQRHIDAALRYRHTLSDWDVGVSYFTGTARDPRFNLRILNGAPTLVPYFDLITQVGLDAQATLGGWLWKLEAIYRTGQSDSYSAATGGFEYTFPGVLQTGMDLGLITEYLYDERGRRAPTPFANDVLLGCRLALNDEQSSDLLAGVLFDTDGGARNFSIEGSRRLGSDWKLSIEARVYANAPAGDPLYVFRNDDYLQLELAWYF